MDPEGKEKKIREDLNLMFNLRDSNYQLMKTYSEELFVKYLYIFDREVH
jgi:hypothetical protein